MSVAEVLDHLGRENARLVAIGLTHLQRELGKVTPSVLLQRICSSYGYTLASDDVERTAVLLDLDGDYYEYRPESLEMIGQSAIKATWHDMEIVLAGLQVLEASLQQEIDEENELAEYDAIEAVQVDRLIKKLGAVPRETTAFMPSKIALQQIGELVLAALSMSNIDLNSPAGDPATYRQRLRDIASIAVSQLANDPNPELAEKAKGALAAIEALS